MYSDFAVRNSFQFTQLDHLVCTLHILTSTYFKGEKKYVHLFSYLFAITSPQLITDIHLYSPLSDPDLVFTVYCVFHQSCYIKSFIDGRFNSFSRENVNQIASCPVMTQSSEVWTHPWLGC